MSFTVIQTTKLQKNSQLNHTFTRLFRLDTDKHGVGVAFAVNDGLSLGVNLDGLDVLDFPPLLNGVVKVGLAR